MNWNQLKTILWLRWQLTRNQWARSKYGLGAIFSGIVIIAGCALAGMCFLGALLGAAYGLRDAPSSAVMLAWLMLTGAFLFLWMIGLLMELQRSETVDLQRLMHLPVLLGQIFVTNYIASHFSFSLIIAVPAAIGLSLGLTIARGPSMLLLLPLSLSMIFMITAWTYCLRGWLAAMMTDPRRRRSIVVLLTLVFVLVAQAPNFYFNVFGRAHSDSRAMRQDVKIIEGIQKFVPPFWVSLSARSLAEQNPWPALMATVGFLAVGTMGLRRAYRSTLSYYYGDTGDGVEPANAVAPVKKGRPTKRAGNLLEIHLPGVKEEASVVALASIRSMVRAPEVKMAWLMSFVVTVFVGASILFRSSSEMSENLKPFIALGATAFSFFVLFQLLGNLFGFDRDGFGTFVLSPIDRQMILLGKNISILPVIACSGFLLLSLVTIWLRLPVLTALAAIFQIATLSIVACIFGNLLSICVPYRIQPASLKPTKIPSGTAMLMVVCQLLFPVAMLPIFAPPLIEVLCRIAGVSTALPINLILSILLFVVAVCVYWLLLAPMGRLLQRREAKILQAVTSEVE